MSRKEFPLRRWIIATSFGWILGIVGILLIAVVFDTIGIEQLQFFIGLAMGSAVGWKQSSIIDQFEPIGNGWRLASAAGMGIPFLCFDIVSLAMYNPVGGYSLPLCIVAGSSVTGYLQYRLLRARTNYALLWIAGSVVSWIAAGAAVLSMDTIKLFIHHNLALFIINLSLILGSGIVLGSVSGLFLQKIIEQSEGIYESVRSETETTGH